MNRDALLARVRRQTLVDSTELSDAQIVQDLEEGIMDVAARYRWPFFYASTTIVTAASQAEYTLPADLMYIETLKHQGVRAPLHRTTEAIIKETYGDDLGEADLPHLWYTTSADQIAFAPVPGAIKTIVLTYYKTPDLAADFAIGTDEPMWHPSFHKLLVDWAAASFWEREEQEDRASFYFNRYLNQVELMGAFYATRMPRIPFIIGGGTRKRYRRPPYVGWPE